jgi:hypothetical protein
MEQALFDMDDAGSLLKVCDAKRLPRRASYHCKSGQTPRTECTEFSDTALTLGVVTSEALTSVELPGKA